MTVDTKDLQKRMEKKIEKSIRAYIGSWKTALLIGCLSLIVGSLALLHGLSESWASEIAKSIITIDGIILGFTFVGVTFFSPDKSYSMSHIDEIFRKHFEDIWKELKAAETLDRKKIEGIFTSILESAAAEIVVIPTSISMSMISLAISVALALSLFGVSDVTANNFLLELLFSNILILSIGFLMEGIFLTYKFIEQLTSTTFKMQSKKALEKSLENLLSRIMKDLEDMNVESKEKRQTSK